MEPCKLLDGKVGVGHVFGGLQFKLAHLLHLVYVVHLRRAWDHAQYHLAQFAFRDNHHAAAVWVCGYAWVYLYGAQRLQALESGEWVKRCGQCLHYIAQLTGRALHGGIGDGAGAGIERPGSRLSTFCPLGNQYVGDAGLEPATSCV